MVATGAVGMIQRERRDGGRADPDGGNTHINEFAPGAGVFEVYGEVGAAHLRLQSVLQLSAVTAGIELDHRVGVKERRKERQALQMVPMQVGEKKVDQGLMHQRRPEIANAGAG